MKRIIIDFNKITEELHRLYQTEYPSGYTSNDIVKFQNATGEWIKCIELRTEEAIYLIKMGVLSTGTNLDDEKEDLGINVSQPVEEKEDIDFEDDEYSEY